ncbi:MAG TPA: SAV_6107 family HEPN domain-containing protein [Gordonia sp. (in: high G+C Gram-positive bacteria)]|uniref:SAV_6107 family HEPN domain-containing protein n=1 Tax=unclassified Gordonia (in: high G+C Gram-positive bacteria) TaxID=2657482 RepID=UPI000FB17DBE|nr:MULTISPECIES: SAV_6107 family HEPN domain-containing protein [unclassified Gordonia (in: high G+C Gram-positive bacteria)]RTL06244.1 MAG: hypothetical protein EKK62_13220 [Acidimicrobiia bacterium]HNP58686.1 SAV_6107 family HEPN domain-containing protein [Gordonia sp. (in: high G+C Gram-positive bacteria)]HRC51114.1 SAV_6107 family HEPN domain-containing protein [Gordonia sp. (in: high G+C Gram-positive bacteria)]
MATRAGSVIEPRIVADAHRLLDQAVAIADEGDIVVGNAERLRLYYLAALRAAGAVLVVLESRRRAPRGQRSAWVRLEAQSGADAALGEDAAFFAGHSALRQRVETGLVREVDQAVVARMRIRLSGLIAIAEDTLAGYEQGRTPSTSVRQSRSA